MGQSTRKPKCCRSGGGKIENTIGKPETSSTVAYPDAKGAAVRRQVGSLVLRMLLCEDSAFPLGSL